MPRFVLALLVLLPGCASRRYQVSDTDYFTDGYALDAKTIQLVESHDDTGLLLPAAERHARNCDAAAARARDRHRQAFPASKDEGERLSRHFNRNAGCTVRMAFRKE